MCIYPACAYMYTKLFILCAYIYIYTYHSTRQLASGREVGEVGGKWVKWVKWEGSVREEGGKWEEDGKS